RALRLEPIAAPLVDDRAGVVEPVTVGPASSDFPGAGQRLLWNLTGRHLLSPRRAGRCEPAAHRKFPFGFRREPPAASGVFTEPYAERHGLIPRHPDDRLEWAVKTGFAPPGWRSGVPGREERRIFGVGHRISADMKRVDRDRRGAGFPLEPPLRDRDC